MAHVTVTKGMAGSPRPLSESRAVSRYAASSAAVSIRHTVASGADITKTEDELLVELSPAKRWLHIAKHNTLQFFGLLIILVGSLYALISAAFAFAPTAMSFMSINAYAQSNIVPTPSETTSPREWLLLVLLALFGVWSLGAISFSKTPATVTYAKDTGKFILGLLGGFFGSGKLK